MVFYTAITLKLNTKPWIEGGITSRENYSQQLHAIASKFNATLDNVEGYELDKQCQLHVHATLVSTKILHRVSICKWYRHTYKKHSIWLVPISNLKNWKEYCLKTGNEEEKYHMLCRFYDRDNYDKWDFNYDDVKLNKQKHWEKCEIEAQFI